MTNKQLSRYIKEWKRIRLEWIDILVKNPDHSTAPVSILKCTHTIEFLRGMWNWNEEGEMP